MSSISAPTISEETKKDMLNSFHSSKEKDVKSEDKTKSWFPNPFNMFSSTKTTATTQGGRRKKTNKKRGKTNKKGGRRRKTNRK
jgi:hypothetical protein